MAFEPEFTAFADTYDAGAPQVVSTQLIADLETPVSVMMKLAADTPNSFLLESVEGGVARGRYSIIGLNPDVIWRANGANAEIARAPDLKDFKPCPEPTLDSLRALLAESRIDLPEDLPPMAAGVVGYLGYDTVRLIEHLPDINPDVLDCPDGLFIRPQIMVIFDTIKDTLTVVTPVRPADGVSAKAAYARASERIEDVIGKLERPAPIAPDAPVDLAAVGEATSNTPEDTYKQMVLKAKDYILAGDVFQVVLSQRFEVPFELPAFALYRALRRVNPSPFLFFFKFEGFSIVGSSPEILVRLRDGEVTIRPIAGTRPRGATVKEDVATEAELLADPKERAEHLMLLDLGRNDVGRVSKPGSVSVDESFTIERYSHVMHIVSHVTGQIDNNRYDAIGALSAGFPAGTLSGAPKVRAMEIIDELELEKRGVYAGGVGYFSADGSMDTCIVLRTAIVKDGKMYVQAGAGVVADSDPDYEHRECVAKSRALVTAAAEAVRFASAAKRGQ